MDGRLAEELDLIDRQLAQIGNAFADDHVLSRRHADNLGLVKNIQQKLRFLSSVVGAADKAVAVDELNLSEVRTRLRRKAIA
jgi:hypothetical protein